MGWPLSSVERHVVLKNIYEAYYFLGNFFFNENKFVLMIIRFRRLECKLRLKKVISYLWEFDIDFLKLSQWLDILYLI